MMPARRPAAPATATTTERGRQRVVCATARGLGGGPCACCGSASSPTAAESAEPTPRATNGALRRVNAGLEPTDSARRMNEGAGLIPPAEIFRGNTLRAPFALGVSGSYGEIACPA